MIHQLLTNPPPHGAASYLDLRPSKLPIDQAKQLRRSRAKARIRDFHQWESHDAWSTVEALSTAMTSPKAGY